MQIPIGSVFKDPGCYAFSTASAKPVAVTSSLVTGQYEAKLDHTALTGAYHHMVVGQQSYHHNLLDW